VTTVPDLTITAARADILRAIADPTIEVYASLGSIFNASWLSADVWVKYPDGTRRKVTKTVGDMDEAGLVERAPGSSRAPRPYTLTPDGEKALADYDAQRVTEGK
jgi:hypothetical protein